ncbi:citrate lyase acyl carrier protein [Fusibacter ferrireducens]|uniref:Citrate lyase acyl carrier protein n=1 Tax=Fusibacter ferrireducens TaxID=2785058 RepID=A0ABR9ZXU3_9FIRM|nr:citrate lyase acyl carrier protein [Fusibacter ferrireducens]MBF4695293.1 citrate lyase acyl carrier protein [Fusibacter ferrireducens]
MKLKKEASAGTMDSCDINIRLENNPLGTTNEIHLKSIVEKQYGDHIRNLISQVIDKYGLESVVVNAVDRGALDCTIKARVESAIQRGLDQAHTLEWSVVHHE